VRAETYVVGTVEFEQDNRPSAIGALVAEVRLSDQLLHDEATMSLPLAGVMQCGNEDDSW
jgi:hypothetical protein